MSYEKKNAYSFSLSKSYPGVNKILKDSGMSLCSPVPTGEMTTKIVPPPPHPTPKVKHDRKILNDNHVIWTNRNFKENQIKDTESHP